MSTGLYYLIFLGLSIIDLILITTSNTASDNSLADILAPIVNIYLFATCKYLNILFLWISKWHLLYDNVSVLSLFPSLPLKKGEKKELCVYMRYSCIDNWFGSRLLYDLDKHWDFFSIKNKSLDFTLLLQG